VWPPEGVADMASSVPAPPQGTRPPAIVQGLLGTAARSQAGNNPEWRADIGGHEVERWGVLPNAVAGVVARQATWRSASTYRWWLLGVLAVALAARIVPFVVPGTLFGVVNNDDGVHWGLASYLVHGRLPYRDFVFLHPPGIGILLTPFVLLGELVGSREAFALARLAVVALGVVNTALVATLGRRLWGARAGLAAGALYALAPAALNAERTLLLEPVVNAFALLGLLALLDDRARRATLAAGALFAAGISVKMFGAVFPVVAVGWLLLRQEQARARSLAAATTAGVVVLCAPFAAAAPRAFVDQVVWSQLSRPPYGEQRRWLRLADMTGLGPVYGRARDLPGLQTILGGEPLRPPTWLVALVVLAVVPALVLSLRRRRLGEPEGLLALILLATTTAFLLSSSYFSHYAAVVAIPLALLTGRWLAAFGGPLTAAGAWRRTAVVTVSALTVLGAIPVLRAGTPQPDLGTMIAAVVPEGSCVVSDTVATAALAGRFEAAAPCPAVVDQRGTALVLPQVADARAFYPTGFQRTPPFQDYVRSLMAQGDVEIVNFDPLTKPEWDGQTRRQFLSTYQRVLRAPPPSKVQVWVRVGG